MDDILQWLVINIVGLFGIMIGGFIAYHIFFLSSRLSKKDRLKHKHNIKEGADKILADINKNELRRKVLLVNINRYFKDYPSNEEKIGGYGYIKGEIKTTCFDGIEFFCDLPKAVYKNKNEKYTFNKKKGVKQKFVVLPVGIVPYEWIDHINEDGDEYDGYPQLFVKFKGKIPWKWIKPFGYPYKKIIYYQERENYQKGSDHPNMQFREFTQVIKK